MKLIIEYTGWIEADPKKSRFILIGGDEIISGEKYLELEAKDRAKYSLYNFSECYTSAFDGNDDLTTIVESEE